MVAQSKKYLARSRMESYFQLVRAHPLRMLKSKQDHARAIEVLARLASRELDSGEVEYAEVLGQLVSNYESTTHGHRADLTGLKPAVILNHLIEASGISASELNKLVGQSTASAYRSGRRQVSRENARKLGSRFGVSPSLLLFGA